MRNTFSNLRNSNIKLSLGNFQQNDEAKIGKMTNDEDLIGFDKDRRTINEKLINENDEVKVDRNEARSSKVATITQEISERYDNSQKRKKSFKRPFELEMHKPEEEILLYKMKNDQSRKAEELLKSNNFKFSIYDKDDKAYNINTNVAQIKVDKTRFFVVKENYTKNEELAEKIIHKETKKKDKILKNKKYRSNSFSAFEYKMQDDILYSNIISKNKLFFEDKLNIQLYFTELFETVASNALSQLNDESKVKDQLLKQKLISDLELEKKLVFGKILEEAIPIFGAVDSLEISRSDLEDLNTIWNDFEGHITKNKVKFSFNVKVVEVDFHLILHKIFNPPVIGCVIGLFFGMSGIRDIFFSSNHYIKNIYSVTTMASKTFVPLLFVNVGNSLMNSPKFNVNFSLKRYQVVLSFIMTFIIIPFMGMGLIKFWKAIYGGIIDDSKVFRFAMFVSACLPVSPNFIIVLNLLDGFYLDEYSYVLNKQTVSLIFSETILLLNIF